MKKLYRYHRECGRGGCVSGIFVADDDTVWNAIGKEVVFGEILGKHSSVRGPLQEDELRVLTDDQGFIDMFEAYGCESGYNPLDYIREKEAEV